MASEPPNISLQELLDATPPPDASLLDGGAWKRTDYRKQVTDRISLR
jgi:hypothetical protein